MGEGEKCMNEAAKVWMATRRSAFDSKHSVYGRSTSVEIGTYKCEICETTTTIMSIDGSGGEYGSFDCCKPCFDKLWENT
jgi:hypothetical protein